jgi:hypothetical protein
MRIYKTILARCHDVQIIKPRGAYSLTVAIIARLGGRCDCLAYQYVVSFHFKSPKKTLKQIQCQPTQRQLNQDSSARVSDSFLTPLFVV